MAGASPQEDATASGAQVAAESQAPAQVEAPASKPSKRVHYRNTRERWRGKPFIEDRNRALDFQLPTASGAFDGGFVR
jgi:hypothetical protein